MILEHYPLVRAIVGRMARRFPSNVEIDDLVNVGMLGLIDALDRFDSTRGVPFKAFAEIRVRGQIMDYLRGEDWVPRAVRRKFLRIDAARTRLRLLHKREPTREEMAAELEISPGHYDDLCGDAEIRRLISLDTPMDEDGSASIGDHVAAGDDSIVDKWIEGETTEEITNAVERLPHRERTVVTLYYMRGQQLKEIGVILGVTESRVCQIRNDGVLRLRSWLRRGTTPPRAAPAAAHP
jgi:RNA polymerase sigma factor for flagellar operon FliA